MGREQYRCAMPITLQELQRLRNVVDRSSYIRMAIQLGRDSANPYTPYQIYPDSLTTNFGITREELHTELSTLTRNKQIQGTLPSFTATWTDPSILTSYSPEQVIQLRGSGMFRQKGYLFFCLGAENPNKAKTQPINPSRLIEFYGMTIADFFSELGRMVGEKTLATDIDRITVQWLAYSSSDLQTTASETIAAALEDMRKRITEINEAIAPYALQASLDELVARVALLETATKTEPLNPYQPSEFSLFIDCGRSDKEPILREGKYWIADCFYSGGSHGDNGVANTLNTNSPEIFQTERFGNSTYTIPVLPGNYMVSLFFAENFHSQAGDRVFDVLIQGVKVLSNFDILREVGESQALVKTFSGISALEQIVIEICDPGTIMGISVTQEAS